MLTTAENNTAIARRNDNPTNLEKLKAYAKMAEVQERFTELLGSREGRAYVQSVIIAVANSEALQACTPKSIMISAMRAASLHLSVDPIMRQAHLVPYGNTAQLIVDYHGLVQLSENTGYYSIAPNVSEVWEGELVKIDRFTGAVEITGEKKSDTVIGWCGFFEAKNGIKRYLYMTNEQCDEHGKKYSKAFNSPKSGWTTDREKMRRKTVLRLLVQRWGRFSPQAELLLRNDDDLIVEGQTVDMPSDEDVIVERPDYGTTDQINQQLGFN